VSGPAEVSTRYAVGGEIELTPEQLLSVGVRPAPLPGRTIVSGRTGLRLIAQRLEGPILLPSYLCASMVQPFHEERVPVSFYPVSDDLTVDADALLRCASRVQPAAILAVAYFGFPLDPKLQDALAELRPRCRIVEDCVQGSLLEFPSPAVGSAGDFVLTSFRKYLPLPDGGIVIGPATDELPQLPPSRSSYVTWRAMAKALCSDYMDGAPEEVVPAYRALLRAAEDMLDHESPLEGMSDYSATLLQTLDLPAAAARRRENYAFLAALFADPDVAQLARPMRPELPERVSPLLFPVRVDPRHRNAVRDALREQRFFLPVHWPLPVEVSRAEFPDAHELSESILGLHVDQRYDAGDMELQADRLITMVRSAVR
jgi:dTDP-4-amino-4,6-dideoxygalactose transaminase